MREYWESAGTIVPNAPAVVSETLNGEAIMMHHGTGQYFNTPGSGAILWEAIEQGATLDELVSRLAKACSVTFVDARAVVIRFLDTLAAHALVRPGEAPIGVAPPFVCIPFEEPELGVHGDLADMLLLDPVHEVDEAGWPAPNIAEATSWSD